MPIESIVFQELRPLCVELSRITFQPQEVFDPNSRELLNALEALENKLASFQGEQFSQNLADYLFVPIASLLKQKSLFTKQTERVLLIISHLLRLCWRVRGTFPKELAQQFLPLINFLIQPDGQELNTSKRSNDYKRASAMVLLEYFKSLESQLYCDDFFSPKNMNNLSSLGYCITIELDILGSSIQDSEVQLLVLEALSVLYEHILNDGETLSHILPGNVSSFSRLLIQPGLNVNYKVVVKALNVFAKLLLIVYDDLSLNVQKAPITLQLLADHAKETPEFFDRNLIVSDERQDGDRKEYHRNNSWLRATSSQVKIALEMLIPKVIKRDNPNVRCAIAEFASNILSRCRKSLSNCEHLLLSALVTLRMDPKHEISKHISCLGKIIKEYGSQLDHMIRFEDVQKMESLIFALSKINDSVISFDDFLIPNIIYQVVDTVEDLCITSQKKKILEQDRTLFLNDQFEEGLTESKEALMFIFSNMSGGMESTLGKLFVQVGVILRSQNQLHEIIESFLSGSATATMGHKTAALWSASLLVNGIQEKNIAIEDELLDFGPSSGHETDSCYQVLEYTNALSEEIVFATEGNELTHKEEITLCTILFSLQNVCIVLKEDFRYELIDHIYTVIENLASKSPVVRRFAQSCSLTIAQFLYQGSLKDMISANIDYLTDTISTRLNSGLTERVSTVLIVVCKIAGYETVESFKDIFETIFKLIDYYHGYDEMCLQFFQLFEVIVAEIKKRYFHVDSTKELITNHNHSMGSYKPWGMTDLHQVLSMICSKDTGSGSIVTSDDIDEESDISPKNFQEYFDSKIREADSDDEDDSDIDEQEDNQIPGMQKDQIPWVSPIPVEPYRVLLQIFNYGDRLLTHKSRYLRIQVLNVMRLSTPLLASQYDSLLPQVAQSWDILVQCTIEPDLTVVKHSSDCLREIIHYSQDFITKRFLELWDIWRGKSDLVKTLSPQIWNSVHRGDSLRPYHKKYPPIVYKSLVSMCYVLLEGLTISASMIPDDILQEMVYSCLQVLPAQDISQQSILIADVVYGITHQFD